MNLRTLSHALETTTSPSNESHEVFQSHRRFRLWDRSPSHDQVLIRSPATREAATNIDIVFVGVEFMSLATSFDGLTVTRETSLQHANVPLSPSANGTVFLLRTAGKAFVVVAVGGKVLENTLGIFESCLERFSPSDSSSNRARVLAHLQVQARIDLVGARRAAARSTFALSPHRCESDRSAGGTPIWEDASEERRVAAS